jgi:hypothetical protein
VRDGKLVPIPGHEHSSAQREPVLGGPRARNASIAGLNSAPLGSAPTARE